MRLARVSYFLFVSISCNLLLSACSPAEYTAASDSRATSPAVTAPEEEVANPESPPAQEPTNSGPDPVVQPEQGPTVPPPASQPPPPEDEAPEPEVPPAPAPPQPELPEPEAPQSNDPVITPEGTIPPDDEALRRAEAATSTDDFQFETAETIDALSYGLVGDGVTDNTVVFRGLLAGGNRTIHVPPGDYVTGVLEFDSNTVLILEPGVTLRDAGQLGLGERLLNIRTEKVHIRGWGARVVASRASYTTGEQRHGVYIYGADHVLIEGLESSNHGGDGIYIGGPKSKPSTDVMLTGCRADNNRRQGLSITSARRVRVIDCEFINTSGTAPEYGIDLEPNYAVNVLDQITLLRPYTRGNRGGDIMINLHAQDSTSERIDVSIIDHSADADPPQFYIYVREGVDATLRYSVASAPIDL